MSNYDKHPGGGFKEVGGYIPPAGTMADQERQRREDEERRRRQADPDRWAAQSRSSTHATKHSSHGNSHENSRGKSRGNSRGRRAPVRSSPPRSRAKSVTSKSKPADQERKDWNTAFAVIAFLVAGIWAASQSGGDDRWLPGLLAGTFAAYIAGRFYKAIITVAIVGLGFWVWATANK